MSFISIPVFGCWEITGRHNDDELRFTVWVEPSMEQGPVSEAQIDSQKSPERLHRTQVDGQVEARSLVYQLIPELPHEAWVANVSGTVILRAVLKYGRPDELQYVSGPQLLVQPAIDAARYWRYRISDDSEIHTTIAVEFRPAESD
jgi:hypothetical protein